MFEYLITSTFFQFVFYFFNCSNKDLYETLGYLHFQILGINLKNCYVFLTKIIS